MVIIRGRELKMHEGELRGSDVSRGDFHPGVITFDVILILCDSAPLRLWVFSPSLRTGTPLRVRDWSGILCERSVNEASKDIAESPTAEL